MSKRMEEEIELLKKVQKKDEDAFREIYKRYAGRIMNFIYSFVRNMEDTYDLTEEVFFKVWKKIKTIRNLNSFKSWIFTVAANHTRNFLKKKKIYSLEALEEGEDNINWEETFKDPFATQKTPFTHFKNMEQKEKIDKILNSLAPFHREILILFYIENFSIKEIAEKIGVPKGTVLSRLQRARENFRKIGERYGL